MKKAITVEWLNIEDFWDYRPLFYVGIKGNIDTAEVYKYKGEIPEGITHFIPLE